MTFFDKQKAKINEFYSEKNSVTLFYTILVLRWGNF